MTNLLLESHYDIRDRWKCISSRALRSSLVVRTIFTVMITCTVIETVSVSSVSSWFWNLYLCSDKFHPSVLYKNFGLSLKKKNLTDSSYVWGGVSMEAEYFSCSCAYQGIHVLRWNGLVMKSAVSDIFFIQGRAHHLWITQLSVILIHPGRRILVTIDWCINPRVSRLAI